VHPATIGDMSREMGCENKETMISTRFGESADERELK